VKEAFLIGAGFSRAISAAMPVLSDLSEEAFTRVLRDRLKAAIGDDFETQITYLAEDHPWLTAADVLRNRAEFLEASGLIARALLRRQSIVLSQPMPGWLEQLMKSWHERKSDVLTLNYDTLIEKAYLHVIPPQLGPPDHHELYVVPLPGVPSRLSLWGVRPRPEGTLRLLKLHGSINWCYSGSAEFFGESIYDLGIAPGWNKQAAEPEDDLDRKAPDKVNLIVPPTTSKNSFFNNETIRAQWRLAYQILGSAERLYCMGCSLARTDELLNSMLGFGLGDRMVIPINNKLVAGRYKEVLPSAQVDERFINLPDAVPRFVEEWSHS
jgi:hypothetical protein